ncbi:radical SAM/SPASM domain-containing protein [Rivularia sp. UHCC 0363]|uniref:radical SAM/SPASM domain-containing protein n=1 Tax=Rivularia sp. UHCC 0363 TaxID=3110244 RepID=UPI002B21ACAC|nr:radical SAM/SPASM domain-containing protein [Rivularia sp. UHCC 0363]MEA5597539.1 radical SAM protein [Rivularia sp. UHCC 0363]
MSLIDSINQNTLSRLKDSGIWSKISINVNEQKKLQTNQLRPVLLICETINVCNSVCIFCPYSQQSRAKGTMSLELFEKIIQEYREIGGGIISLTPMVGDVLLDKKLIERLEILHRYRDEIKPSLTTNLFALNKFSDAEIIQILNCFERLHISCYGISSEENKEITKTLHYENFISNMKRLVKIWESTEKECDIRVGFRLLYNHDKSLLNKFLLENFGYIFPYGFTSTYANWGNSMSGNLPGQAVWMPEVENQETCVLLLVAMQVYWDGRVSACACCDYDSSEELFIGNINNEKISDIYNGYLSKKIWSQHENNCLPNICKKCTFHQPLRVVNKNHTLVCNPYDYIGG